MLGIFQQNPNKSQKSRIDLGMLKNVLETCNMYQTEGLRFTSKISFRKQTASDEGIQALEKVIVWRISYDDYKKFEGLNSWNIFIRKLLNEIQEFLETFYLEIRTMSAEDRYKKILEEYPKSLVQKIPLKHLSSFLGIAPQSLSRIQKKIQ